MVDAKYEKKMFFQCLWTDKMCSQIFQLEMNIFFNKKKKWKKMLGGWSASTRAGDRFL